MERMDNEIVNKSMVFYESFYDATKDLPVDEFREVWGALFEYAFYGTQPEGLSALSMAIFKMAKPNIDTVVSKRTGGQKGGNPMGNPMGNPKGKGSKTYGSTGANHRVKGADPKGKDLETLHIYDDDDDVDVDKDADVDRQTGEQESEAEAADGGQAGQSVSTPTYEDIVKECRDKKYPAAIASKFFMHYDKSGWKTNDGEAVRDWKKMLAVWVNNEKEEKPPNKKGRSSGWKNYDQRASSVNEELEAKYLDMAGG